MLPDVFQHSRRLPFVAIVLSALLQAALAVLIAFQIRRVFAAFSAAEPMPVATLGIIAAASFAVIMLRVCEKTAREFVAQDYIRELRVALFNHVSRLSADNLQNHKQGSLQIRFVGDLSAIQNWVGSAIPRLISAAVLMPALLYLLYWLHPSMALVGLAGALLSLALMHGCARYLHGYHRQLRVRRGNLASFVAARIPIANYLRISGLRTTLTEQINSQSIQLRQAAVAKSAVVNSFKSIPDIFLQALTLICIALAFYYQLTAAQAAVILAILAIFQQPLRDVADFWDKRNAYLVSRRKCLQLFDMPSVTSGPKVKMTDTQQACIRFNKVKYHAIHLPDISLSSQQPTLIYGDSGSGKSALLKMLVGLIKPTAGSISINDVSTNKISELSRHKLFHYMGDFVPIFSSSLKSTLTLGVYGKVSNLELHQAIELFQLDDLCARLGGIRGRIMENGANLSSGEIKRIAYCRAWLSKSDFLLLDLELSSRDSFDISWLSSLLQKTGSTVIACCNNKDGIAPLFDKTIALSGYPISAT